MSNNGTKKAGIKKPSKQGNLFSFFSKKGKQPSSTLCPHQPMASAPPSRDTTSFSESMSPMLPNEKSQDSILQSVSQNSSSRQIHSNHVNIGDSIELYWADDDEWYQAKVMKKKQASSTYFIQYSIDGQSEWIDLSTESFHLLDVHAKVSLKRRVRTGNDNHGDGSDETEFVLSSSDDEAESACNDADQWMVTDDEDEVTSTKKQKISSKIAVGTTDSKGQRKQKKVEKKNISAKSSLSQYAAPMTVTQHSFRGNGKTSPSSTQITLNTPQHITPITFANGELSAKSNATFCSDNFERSCNNDIATPLATSKSSSKPPKCQQAPNYEIGALNPAGSHIHNHLPFLQNPRDSCGRPSDDPNYDSRALQIQERDWIRIVGKKMTDAVKQWWDLKSMYFDTVLLFKIGT